MAQYKSLQQNVFRSLPDHSSNIDHVHLCDQYKNLYTSLTVKVPIKLNEQYNVIGLYTYKHAMLSLNKGEIFILLSKIDSLIVIYQMCLALSVEFDSVPFLIHTHVTILLTPNYNTGFIQS